MPTVLVHSALAAGAFLFWDRGKHPGVKGPLIAAGLASLPDIDVVWWGLTSYGELWGHRGMTHSLTFAVISGTLTAFVLRKQISLAAGFWGTALFFTLMVASHGFFDAMTNGGLGIGFFSPFDRTRYFLPFTPVPVAPVTVNPFDSYLQGVLWREALMFGPLAWTLGTWWRWPEGRTRNWNRVLCAIGLLGSAVVWGRRLAA